MNQYNKLVFDKNIIKCASTYIKKSISLHSYNYIFCLHLTHKHHSKFTLSRTTWVNFNIRINLPIIKIKGKNIIYS